MTQRSLLFLLVALPSACATMSNTAETLPVQPQLVPSSLAPAQALQRVTTILHAHGFEEARDVLAPSGQAPGKSIAWASGKLVPDDLMGSQRCTGAIEVIQASAQMVDGCRTQLRLSCHTERLINGPSGHRSCDILRESGCAEAGDQMVGRLALDAVGL